MTDADAVENVLLITVDSLRSDAIGYGEAGTDTPVIDGIAERGTTFENAFANGNWTPFSFPSILASTPVFTADGDIGVGAATTVADRLSAAGVGTAGYNAANGFLTGHWSYDRGFDEFDSFVNTSRLNPYSQYLAAHPTVQGWVQLLSSPFRRAANRLRRRDDRQPVANTSKLREVERGAVDYVEDRAAADEPFFLWLHYMDTHTPYVPAPRHLREVSSDRLGTPRMFFAHARTGLGLQVGPGLLGDLRTLYDATVRQVDASVGRVLETLEDTGVADSTATIVAGDHGEEFQEHGHLSHYPKLYDELIHVPYVVDVPGAPGRSVDEHVGLDTIPPTICDLLDVSPAPDWRGRSLLDTLRSGTAPPDDPVVSVAVRGESVTQQPIPRQLEDGELLVSARTDEWAYIEHTDSGAAELYHRPADPTMQENLLEAPEADRPPALEELRQVVRSHVADIERAVAGEAGEDSDGEAVDDGLATRLEALGYR